MDSGKTTPALLNTSDRAFECYDDFIFSPLSKKIFCRLLHATTVILLYTCLLVRQPVDTFPAAIEDHRFQVFSKMLKKEKRKGILLLYRLTNAALTKALSVATVLFVAPVLKRLPKHCTEENRSPFLSARDE